MAYLEAEDLRLDQREGLAVNLDKTLALLYHSLSIRFKSQAMCEFKSESDWFPSTGSSLSSSSFFFRSQFPTIPFDAIRIANRS